MRTPQLGVMRVQAIDRSHGRQYTILDAASHVVPAADLFLATLSPGTSRTYAYHLLDHLCWLDANFLSPSSVRLEDLKRYMAVLGADYAGPVGRPWRTDRAPYSQAALDITAACLKGFYIRLGADGVNSELAQALKATRLPTRADRRRHFLGHVIQELPTNPLRPKSTVRQRHPKMLPDGASERLKERSRSARDLMIMTWLHDGGFRVGELCSLYLMDLHLRDDAECGQCRVPHVHICHREGNLNQARVKTKRPWHISAATVVGGTIRRVSPAMIHTYFAYMTTEYDCSGDHGMLLLQLDGPHRGAPLATAGVRAMVRRTGRSAGFERIRPHAYRHDFVNGVLDASGGNIVLARDAGGWSSAATVDDTYSHPDMHSPQFSAALQTVWDTE